MPDLQIFTPAYVSQPNHFEMIRLQSLLARRLRLHAAGAAGEAGAGVTIRHTICYDRADPQYRPALAELGFDEAVFLDGPPTGVRRPTNYFLAMPRREDTYVLRVIQDTFVDDPRTLMADLGTWMGGDGRDVLAGSVEPVPLFVNVPYLDPLLARSGLEVRPSYRHVQGALMFARLDTWRRYYLPMVPEVSHFFDDVVFSEWLSQSGGRLVSVAKCFSHLHDIAEEVARRRFEAEQAELEREESVQAGAA